MEPVGSTPVDGLEVTATAFGQVVDPFAPPAACLHRSCGVDCLTALLNDDAGQVIGREVRVRVRCMECGVPMSVSLDVRRPRSGESHGIVLTVTPSEE